MAARLRRTIRSPCTGGEPSAEGACIWTQNPKTVTSVTKAYSATASASKIRWACWYSTRQGDHDVFLECLSAWEGFNVAFNGSKGRIEAKVVEQSYINSGGDKALEGAVCGKKIDVLPDVR